MNENGKQKEEREEEREEEERKEERKGVPHFSPKLREVGTSAAHEERVRSQHTAQRSHRNSIVIPTGASVSRRETEAEWRDLVSLMSSHLPF